jgi:hypothetical protein
VGLKYDAKSGVCVFLATQSLVFGNECHVTSYFTCLNILCDNCQNAKVKCPEFCCMVVKLIVHVNLVHLTYEKLVSYFDDKQKILLTFKDFSL